MVKITRRIKNIIGLGGGRSYHYRKRHGGKIGGAVQGGVGDTLCALCGKPFQTKREGGGIEGGRTQTKLYVDESSTWNVHNTCLNSEYRHRPSNSVCRIDRCRGDLVTYFIEEPNKRPVTRYYCPKCHCVYYVEDLKRVIGIGV